MDERLRNAFVLVKVTESAVALAEVVCSEPSAPYSLKNPADPKEAFN